MPVQRRDGKGGLGRHQWLDPRPGVFHRRPKPPNCPTRRWSPARHFGRFVPGKGGSAQGRSRTEHRNQTRVPGVFISYHGACRRLAILQKTQTHHRRHDDDNVPRQKNAPCAIARPIPRVECVASGHGGAVVLVSRARSFVWCVTPRGAGAFKSQAAAAAWWDVAWYVGRTKRHGGGF